tara:strand:+ start:37 stop:558 length:522 start_codon:yes stop_codon:yes gene_type:complete
MAGYKFGASSKARLEQLDPRIQEILNEAIGTSPFDFKITQGKRTYDEQFDLWKKGRKWNPELGEETSPEAWEIGGDGSVVTKTMKSKHLSGRAFDIVALDKGAIDWKDTEKYKKIATHLYKTAKSLGYEKDFQWGGDWKYNWKDLPHYEIREKKASDVSAIIQQWNKEDNIFA